jgi:hypothetical protein
MVQAHFVGIRSSAVLVSSFPVEGRQEVGACPASRPPSRSLERVVQDYPPYRISTRQQPRLQVRT